MKPSRALAIAADSIDLDPERLRAIAQALALERRRSPKPARTAGFALSGVPPTAPEPREGADGRRANLQTMQASRSVLVRTIAMLK